jgi:hypothetical protein
VNSPHVITPLRFRDLTGFGRFIIVAVAILTALVAVAAFATSYGALYALVRDTGLYSDRLTLFYPLLLDAAFIAAELAAILGGILRGPRGWPVTVMLIAGSLTIAFNVMHAMGSWDDWTRGVIAALPPVMMILAFQVDLAIVAWVMKALGKTEQAFDGAGSVLGVPQMAPQMQTRWSTGTESGQSRQWGSVDGGGVVTTKSIILAELERLGPTGVTQLGPEGITEELAARGIETKPRYVRKVMDEAAIAPSTNGKGHA